MKRHIKVFVILGLVLTGATVFGLSVSAQSVDVQTADLQELTTDVNGEYVLEDMLTYAILDEYAAKATYQIIIEAFGEVRPFTNIVNAEQTHIDLLLPLFETYGIEVPEENVNVVAPDSIASAIVTGIEAEKANIELYETFLLQNLPEDVRDVFEQLVMASKHHLAAFSKDRAFGTCYDIANQFRSGFRNMFGSNGSQRGGNGGARN